MFLMLIALLIMPVAFLYFAVKMRLTPLNTVCLALLSSTAFSCGCWTVINTPEKQKQAIQLFKEEFEKQLVVVEERMKAQKIESSEYAESIETLRENFNRVADKAFLLIPSTSIFLWHLVTLGILYSLAAWLGPKFGYKVEPFPAFKDWTFDWNLVWLYIIGWVLYFLIGGIEGLPGAKVIQILGANCFIMSNILYLIIGFSLLFFMYDKYKIGFVPRVGLSIIALMFSQFMIWLGLIDVWAEFRLKKSTPEVSDNSDDDDFFDF
jgi:hypothetical protein